jgi:protein-tyrosine phosphatase
MREIIPGRLWIGNAGDGRDPERLTAAGVMAVVNLAAEEPSPLLPRSMVYCRFPIMDGEQEGEGVLDTAIHTAVRLLRNQVPTLVHCGAGMSRSPAVVAAALSIVEGGSPEERLRQVVAGHPHDVSPQLWEAIQVVCRASQRRT